jgi:hypothetical protein
MAPARGAADAFSGARMRWARGFPKDLLGEGTGLVLPAATIRFSMEVLSKDQNA